MAKNSIKNESVASNLAVVDQIRAVFTVWVAQVSTPFSEKTVPVPYFPNWLSILIGSLGGLASFFAYRVAHFMHPILKESIIVSTKYASAGSWLTPGSIACTILLLGLLTFSAATVYKWLNQLFKGEWNGWKAIGTVVGIEGVMVIGASIDPIAGPMAAGTLIAINTVATACQAYLDAEKPSKPRAKAVGSRKASKSSAKKEGVNMARGAVEISNTNGKKVVA